MPTLRSQAWIRPLWPPPVLRSRRYRRTRSARWRATWEGTWKGHGFNTIWRPHNPASPQDRFLELNLTDEKLVFTKINGAIPNRGWRCPTSTCSA